MYRKPISYWFIILFILIIGSGCKPSLKTVGSEGEMPMTVQITSTAFTESKTIPQKYTCDGVNVSPPLSWSGIPSGAKSLALVADDPDAPGGTWVHWVIYNIPITLTSLPENVAKTATVEGIGTQGNNDFRKPGYGGPCPPKGSIHRYFFKVYALDVLLNLKPGSVKADVEKAMRGHILVQGQLMGKYGR
jgi:Raf kinase inhibitor-like YbhB/YbcL family protein